VSAGASVTAPDLPDWGPLDSFVASTAQTLYDASNLHAAIGYMQRLDGEKHLVFVTENTMLLPRSDDDDNLAAAASDARVAVSVIQTGGVAPDAGSMMGRSALRNIAEKTGGVASMVERSELGLALLDEQTRSGYLLGYYASNTRSDGRFRSITVVVSRPNTTARFRHGYHARADNSVFDRRRYITEHRLGAAARYEGRLADIRVRLKASLKTENGVHYATIEGQVDPSRLYFERQNGIHTSALDVAIVSKDGDERILGGGTHPLRVALTDAAFEEARKEWIRWSWRVAVPSGTRYLRVVVYDYMSDLVGVAGAYVM